MGDQQAYDEAFYRYVDDAASASAAVVVPLVLELVDVRSVVDVGCGPGAWLAAFRAHAVDDILGLDHPRVTGLRIAADRFRATELTEPIVLGRTFDLAVSLEVAEHLPADAADGLVEALCAAAPVVLFSAAIPGQGGEEHLNEQPPGYWAARFARHGYEPVDVVRPAVWDDARVAAFYRQNMLLYVAAEARGRLRLADRPVLANPPMHLVHPDGFAEYQAWANRHLSTPLSFTGLLRRLPAAARRAVQRRLRHS